MHRFTASSDAEQYAFLAHVRRGTSCERSHLHSLLRGRYPPEARNDVRGTITVSVGLLARPAQIAGTARLRSAAVTTQTLNFKGNPSRSGVKTLGIYTSVVRGFGFHPQSPEWSDSRISTASHRIAQTFIGGSGPVTSHPRPKAAQFAASPSPTNTWQVGVAFMAA